MCSLKIYYAIGFIFPILSSLLAAIYANTYSPSLPVEKFTVYACAIPGVNVIAGIIFLILALCDKI